MYLNLPNVPIIATFLTSKSKPTKARLHARLVQQSATHPPTTSKPTRTIVIKPIDNRSPRFAFGACRKDASNPAVRALVEKRWPGFAEEATAFESPMFAPPALKWIV